MDELVFGVDVNDPTVIGIIVAVVVVLVSLVIFIVKRSGRSKRYGVLLLGICDAGKTLIFSQLVHQEFKQTCTSIKVNSGEYEILEKNKKLRIIDLPGHERLRGRLLEEYKSLARGLIFVIDSGSLQKEIKEVAEYLYTVLSDRTVSNNAPPLLILCNKQDLTLAKGAKVIRSQLEKEMNTLRVTRAAALTGVGDTANNNTYLGKRDKDFDFSDVKPLKIEFAECSAFGKDKSSDGPELDEIYRWLAKVA
uniref:Signal recognition particle receptor subunit beta n=1 Tax=Arion vulgaris TaxID=1028688 RepID=A0A0B6ZNL5_9EUPU